MNWTEQSEGLCATFQFKDFKAAFAFMTEVAFHAEAQAHHPNWTNVYNTVDFCLNTHDEGGAITVKDRQLAATINKVFEKYNT